MNGADEYPIIKVKNAQTQEINSGWLIGDCLFITRGQRNTWEVWNKYGLTLFRSIDNQEDAIELALWLDETYCQYFQIWEAYPNIDIFSLTMWTVQEGTRIYETIERLRTLSRVSWKDVMGLFHQATGRQYYQNYMKEMRILA